MLRIAIIDRQNPPPELTKLSGKTSFDWGEVVGGCKIYPLHDAQLDVLSSSSRFTFAFAGTGGGKSVLIPLFFAKLIQQHKGKGRFLCIVPDYNKLDQSGILDGLNEVFAGTPYAGRYKPQGHIYLCGSGAKIYIRSATEPDRIEGGHYDGMALDEIKEIPKQAWIYGKGRTDQKGAPVLGVTTPDINGWFYHEVFKPCTLVRHIPMTGDIAEACKGIGYDPALYNVERQTGDGKYYVRQWPSIVNPTYTVESFLDAFRTMSRPLFERRYLGAFSTVDGLIYETFPEAVMPTRLKLPSPAVRVGFAIDWGWEDPTVILVGVECQDGNIYIVEEFYENHISNDRIRLKVEELQRKWCSGMTTNIGLYCDSSEPKTIDYLKSSGIHARRKNVPLIETGIAMVDTRLRAGYLKVFDNCRHLIEESGQYVRHQDREGDLKKPIDKYNHAMDTLRYLITAFDFGRTLKFSVKREQTLVTEEEENERLERVGHDPIQLEDLKAQRENERMQQWRLALLHRETGT